MTEKMDSLITFTCLDIWNGQANTLPEPITKTTCNTPIIEKNLII